MAWEEYHRKPTEVAPTITKTRKTENSVMAEGKWKENIVPVRFFSFFIGLHTLLARADWHTRLVIGEKSLSPLTPQFTPVSDL